jgi:hypothetical protein
VILEARWASLSLLFFLCFSFGLKFACIALICWILHPFSILAWPCWARLLLTWTHFGEQRFSWIFCPFSDGVLLDDYKTTIHFASFKEGLSRDLLERQIFLSLTML